VSVEQVLRAYLHAKDENRPHLLDGVFSVDARLEIRNRSEQISFPAVTVGLAAIAGVLVRRFNQTYETIYSFYLDRPATSDDAFSCDWLVVMTEKESKAVRVGFGRYDWTFRREPALRVSGLIITIEAMLILDATVQTKAMHWVRQLDYPWTSVAAVTRSLPLVELEPVSRYVGRSSS